MKTLKQEEVYLSNYETYLDVIENFPTFIEEVYNEKRVHSAIGYLTPSELEKQHAVDPASACRFELRL
jgi:putative transposase